MTHPRRSRYARRGNYGDPLREAMPPPGHSVSRDIPDSDEGIRFELGRMVRYVRDSRSDGLVVDTSRRIVELCKAKDKKCEIGAIFLWAKNNFRFVNDPTDGEVIASPSRMIKKALEPGEILEGILGEDLIRQMESFGVGESLIYRTTPRTARSCFERKGKELRSRVSGDCDEAASLVASMVAAIGIPSRFRLGGTAYGKDCNFHHVWAQAQVGGKWIDMDITEEKSDLGWFYPHFSCYGYIPIFE